MGFVELFTLGFVVIAFGTCMALLWRVLNKILRAIENLNDVDKHVEDERLRDDDDDDDGEGGGERPRKGFSAPFWDFLIYLGFLATFTAVVYAERGADPYNTHLAMEDWFTGAYGMHPA